MNVYFYHLLMLKLPNITLVNVKHRLLLQRAGGCISQHRWWHKSKKIFRPYPLTLGFIYKLALILFVMTPAAQTTGNIAVYGSAKQLVI